MKTRPGKMLFEVLTSLFRRVATTRYPFRKKASDVPDGFRGRIIYYPERCIGCMMCMKDCPAHAITVRNVGEKQFEAEIDMARCLVCAQCVDTCPKKALEYTKEFELASLKKGVLKVVYGAPGQGTKDTP